ncbi:MAG: hypothetical protein ACHQAY_15340 [Hyphomicrobiales bacterium]
MAEQLVYGLLCLLTGLCGSQRRMGFFGTFLISLLITPAGMLIILLLTGPSHRHWHHWWHFRSQQSSSQQSS